MMVLIVTRYLIHIEKIVFLLLLFCLFYSLNLFNENDFYFHKAIMIFPLIDYFPLFGAGIILYKMKSHKITTFRLSIWVLSIIIQYFLFKNGHNVNSDSISSKTYLIGLVFIYFIFYVFLFNKLKLIVNKITVYLGEISYSLYLIHMYIAPLFLYQD